MPRYSVNKPNTNEWACFSTIVDDFVTGWMQREDYQRWREVEYGTNCGAIEDANVMTYEEAIDIIRCIQEAERLNLTIKALEERPTGEWKREDIEYAIETSACTFHNGKTYYEKEDLMKSMEDLGLFKDEKGEEENGK